MAARLRGLSACVVLVGAVALACGSDGDADGGTPSELDVGIEAAEPAALALGPDGTLLYGERLTGRVFAVATPYGSTDPVEVTALDVTGSAEDQRGLLGLTVDGTGVVYAAWTRSGDGRLVVAEIARLADGRATATELRLAWAGPVSAERANGGHLEFSPSGRIVIGVGDLLDAGAVEDPSTPNGKLLALEPAGDPDQTPEVLSGEWNNPFAFTYDAEGALWVADNAGPSGAERIGRGDPPGGLRVDVREPDEQIAPSALVALDADTLGVCGFLDGRMLRVDLDGDEATLTETVAAEPCRIGALRLPDGRLVLSTLTELLIVAP